MADAEVGQEEVLTWLLLSEGAGFKGGDGDDRGGTGPAGAGRLSSRVINGAKFHNGQIVGGYERPEDASAEAAQAYLDSKRFALIPVGSGRVPASNATMPSTQICTCRR